jgi:1-acyl-sn-glycerol-3-phosphate acyltransferase
MSFIGRLQRIMRVLFRLIAKIEVAHFDRIPQQGAVVVVSNHVGLLDAMLAVTFSPRRDVVMIVARKYEKYRLWRWVGAKLDAVWLDRRQTDFRALRLVQRRLQAGEAAAIAPEGTRSPNGTMQKGKPGAIYLAAKTGAPIVPIALTGTRDQEVKSSLRRLRRLRVRMEAGEPFYLPPLERAGRDAYLEEWTTETMCRIAVMLPGSYRGYYADHPRVAELEAETPPSPPPPRRSRRLGGRFA